MQFYTEIVEGRKAHKLDSHVRLIQENENRKWSQPSAKNKKGACIPDVVRSNACESSCTGLVLTFLEERVQPVTVRSLASL